MFKVGPNGNFAEFRQFEKKKKLWQTFLAEMQK